MIKLKLWILKKYVRLAGGDGWLPLQKVLMGTP